MIELIAALIIESTDDYESVLWSGDTYCSQLLNNTVRSGLYEPGQYVVEELDE